MIVESRALLSRIAASVDGVLLELRRGIVGARLPRVDLRETRDPTRLGSSMPPPVSIGPSIGGISDTLFAVSYAKASSSLDPESLSLNDLLRSSPISTPTGATARGGLFWLFFDSGESGWS